MMLVVILLSVFAVAGVAQAHPLGFNGITDNTTEVGKDSSLGTAWTDIRDKGLTRYNNWRTGNSLTFTANGIPSFSKPHTGDGPTELVMRKDISSDAFLQYFDVNPSPDLEGVNTNTSSNQSLTQKIATSVHEWLHDDGGQHADSCSASLLTPFANCGGYTDNTRRLNPGPHDTTDAIAPDENGGWSDYDQIGSYELAGDTSANAMSADSALSDGEPGDGADIIDKYGSISNAIDHGVVFEWANEAYADQYQDEEEEFVKEHPDSPVAALYGH